jgi:hypothetical protein
LSNGQITIALSPKISLFFKSRIMIDRNTIQIIVFLERNTFNVPFRKPVFDHEWIEFGETTPDEIVERLDQATIAICNKVSLRAEARFDR